MDKPYIYTREEEMVFEALAQELSQNEIFQAYRGLLKEDGSVITKMRDLGRGSQSPTECLEKFDEYSGQLRVLMNLGAKIKRDHGDRIFHRYISVLERKQAFFPCERLPESELRSVTLLMYAPEKTLAIIDYVMRHGGKYLDMCAKLGQGFADILNGSDEKQALAALSVMYPKLLEVNKKNVGDKAHPTRALEAVWWRNTAREFEKRVQWFPNHPGRSRWLRLQSEHLYRIGRKCETIKFVDPKMLGEAPFIRLLEGDADLVYEEFKGSELRKDLAVWKFRIPKHLPIQGIGLHRSAEHEAWSHQRPLFASQLTAAGLGAVILHENNLGAWAYVNGGCVPVAKVDGEFPMRFVFGPCRVPEDERQLGRSGKSYL